MLPPRTPSDGPEDRRRLRILLAEDNPTNQMIACRMLERMGHDVRTAGNGQEAMDAFGSEPFDVILMDMEMPCMDGIAAARAIRAGEASTGGGRIPILAVTANMLDADRAACLDAGMSGFLTKPFNRATLEAALADAVDARAV